MSVDEIKLIHNYFHNIVGTKRVGMYVSEMRRKCALLLYDDGATARHIGRIINVERTTALHYIHKSKAPDREVEKVVDDNMMDWIAKGLIPKTVFYRGGSSYSLVTEPGYVPEGKMLQPNKYDSVVNELYK
jgi:hypothetical protein